MALACNTFWAANGTVKMVGLDAYTEYTVNPPNFCVSFYAIMTAAFLGYLYGYTNILKRIKIITPLIKVMGRYSLDIYLWHILCQHLCVRLNLAYQMNIWVLRVITYVAMFALPILGRYLYTILKEKCTMLLQEIN